MTTKDMENFNLIIIGSGPGGYRAAIFAALRGLSVAIIECDEWGGCCLNRGCVPKKDWYHTARLIAASRRFTQRGIEGTLKANFHLAWEHQEKVVATVQESYTDYMKSLKIRSIVGRGRFLDPHTIAIGDAEGKTIKISGHHIIIATGATAYIPSPFQTVPGKVLTTDMLFDSPPPTGDRVGIIGSGAVATEFAFIFAMFGKRVSWLARSPMLHRLPFSPQAIKTLREALNEHNIYLYQYTSIQAVDSSGSGVTMHFNSGETLELDWICLGTGRKPNTHGLGIESLSIAIDVSGFIERNAYLQTTQPSIYAIGDVASHSMTANHAIADATVAVTNIIEGNTRQQQSRWVPEVIYSAVELARLGLDEDTAEDEGYEPAVGFAAFETSPRALGQDEPEGFVRLLADMDSGKLLGGEIVGAEAGELIHLLSLASDRETALKWLVRGPYNHPTRAEELGNATETLASKWGLSESLLKYRG